MSNQGIDLGIDFGTTNCTVGRVLPDGRTPVHGPMPSVGLAKWENNLWRRAQNRLASTDETYFPIRDLKLLLGRQQPLRAGMVTLDLVQFDH